MNRNNIVLDAIFGVAKADRAAVAAAAAERAAEWSTKDRADAERLAAEVSKGLDWTGVQWMPALYWDNPAAVATIGGVQMVAAKVGAEWGYSPADVGEVVML